MIRHSHVGQAAGELDRIAALDRLLADLEHTQQSQSERLVEARAWVEAEKRKAMAVESWSDVFAPVPTADLDGELTGVWSASVIEGRECFIGTRLALELLTCADDGQVIETLRDYSEMIRDPRQAMLVAFAALNVIATDVFPTILAIFGHQTGDYAARVRLVDAVRHTWAARVGDLKSDEVAE